MAVAQRVRAGGDGRRAGRRWECAPLLRIGGRPRALRRRRPPVCAARLHPCMAAPPHSPGRRRAGKVLPRHPPSAPPAPHRKSSVAAGGSQPSKVRVLLVAGLNAHAVASAAASTWRRASSEFVASYISPNEGMYTKPAGGSAAQLGCGMPVPRWRRRVGKWLHTKPGRPRRTAAGPALSSPGAAACPRPRLQPLAPSPRPHPPKSCCSAQSRCWSAIFAVHRSAAARHEGLPVRLCSCHRTPGKKPLVHALGPVDVQPLSSSYEYGY